ncbi:hypothetical protein LSUE1_G006174 [Lachnellula suecica]|uniref:Uncharacterized protein n=1 Tax=Lachnellula suecica TaxID=602035 RepID=A0A8T9C406_9HELO|nr:hypothetical protein LSUE1_G006174 [Lachnellula suecica]
MALISRVPGAFILFLIFQLFRNNVLARNILVARNGTTIALNTTMAMNTSKEALPTFGDSVQILGAMKRTDQNFQDGLQLDLFSPKSRTLEVQQNKSPLGAQFVTGNTGGPFVALSNYSYIIKMNETANDLIAKLEIPYNPAMLSTMGVSQANTYVATLAADQKSWAIDDATRNVHVLENNTRIIKMTSLDGEYMLVGRQLADTGNVFVQFGQGATRTVNFTGGPGVQEGEFIDGMRFSVQANNSMGLNVNLKPGINPGTLPANTMSLNSFAWIVNTSSPFSKIDAKMLVPFNRNMLVAMKPAGSSPTTMLTVAKRALNGTSGQFMPIDAARQKVLELPDDRIEVSGMTQLDGQYVILVTNAPKPP